MRLKFVCVVMILSGVLAKKDELLDSMYGLQGGNKMAICVSTPRGWRRCDGALYRRDWVVTRAACLATAPRTNLTMQQLAVGGSCERVANAFTCDDGRGIFVKSELLRQIEAFHGQLYTSTTKPAAIANDPRAILTRHYTEDVPYISLYEIRMTLNQLKNNKGTWDTTSTRQVFYVAMHPWFDLALAFAVKPYAYLDGHANATKLRLKLKPHGVYKWMKYYFDITALCRDDAYHARRIYDSQLTRRYPMWYFCVTMLLPSVLFMLFFIYVTLYTGNTVPDKEKHYSKKVTHV